MFDFDPRDHDSRDDERYGTNHSRGSRGGSDEGDRDDDWRQPDIRPRDQMTMRASLAEVQAMIRAVPTLMRTPAFAMMTRARRSVTVMLASATSTRVRCSCAISISRAAGSG